MLNFLRGKLLLVGLGVTLFAKMAISLPILPAGKTGVPQTGNQIVLAVASEEASAEAVPSPAPPLVSGLSQNATVCESPEEVLRALSEERDTLLLQGSELEAHKSELALANEQLQIEKVRLVELKDSITELLKRVEASKTDDLDRLISFYKNMKPTDAARIMDDLDIETTIMVLGTMEPRLAAPIVAKLANVRARAVSKIILERSQLPGDQDLVGIRLN
jgi:flagellar motility protein MotE (MotC chaperone)